MKTKLIAIRLKVEKFCKEQLWLHCIVIAFVCFFAWLFDKYFEALMFIIAHLVLRPKFNKQYHSNFTSVCMVITISIAFFGILFCFPIKVSLLSSIPLAFFVCWIGDVLQTKIELKIENSNLKEQVANLQEKVKEQALALKESVKWALKPKVFDVNTCTEQELIARCQELHFSKENQDLAIEFFIMKSKQSYIADILRIDEKSVQTRKRRMRKILNKAKPEDTTKEDLDNKEEQN